MRVAYPLVPVAMLARLLGSAAAWFICSASPLLKVAEVAVTEPLTSATTCDVPKLNKTRSPDVSPVTESFTACAPALPVGAVQFVLEVAGGVGTIAVKVTDVALATAAV